MRNLKRVLSLALALVMVLGMMVIGTSAATFTDAEEITQTEAVDVMAALGIIIGDNGKFNPTGTFTREAAAKLITYMKLGPTMAEKLAGTAAFSDVAADRWSSKYISYCANLGYITGYNGSFDPTGELTDIALGKLVLCAIGYANGTKYTGDNWAAAVTVDMLEAGLVDNVTGTAITREDAAAMILAGMMYSVTPDKYQIVSKTDATDVVGEFDSMLDATLYLKLIDAAGTTYKVAPAPKKDTLLSKVYGVTYNPADVDDYGRPAVSYKNGLPGAANVTLVFADAPVMTYTNGFSAATVTALTKAGYTLADNIVVNGGVPLGGNAITTVAALAQRNYVGTVIELYNTDANAKTIEKIVVIETYLAEVTAMKTDDKTATNNYVTLTVYNPYVAGEYTTATYAEDGLAAPCTYDYLAAAVAKDDMLLVQYKTADVLDELLAFEPATSVKGTLTATTLGASHRGTIVVGGKTYTMASAYAELAAVGGDLTLGQEYTLYFDANGYVIGAVAKAAPRAQVAVMTQIVKVTNSTNGSIGSAANDYLEAELVFFDGTKEVVKVASFKGTSNPATTYTTANWTTDVATYFNNTVVKYTINAKGLYVLEGQTAGVTASGATVADSVTFDGTNLANNATKFVIRTGAGTTADPYVYSVVTGYANLPAKALNASSAAVTGLKYATGATNVAQYVYITATLKTSSADGKTQAFVTGAPTNVYVDAYTSYFQYPAIIKGEVTTLKVAANNVVSAGKLWQIDTLDANGFVATATDLSSGADTIKTAANGGIVELTTGGWKTYSSDTVVYLIDATAGTVTTADITTLDAYNGIDVGAVYVTYVKAANGSNTPAIAQIIAIEA